MIRVAFSPEAAQHLAGLPRPIQQRIARIIERLRKWPDTSGAKPLSGKLAGHWRIPTGDYRLQFRVGPDKITIEKIGHRDRFYED